MADTWRTAALGDPTPGALDMMRLSLADWLACGIAGVSEPVSQLTRALALEEGGAAQATLFGGGAVPARSAALVNGACSHALDFDDTHFGHIGHPSVAVIPAALAAAQRQGADFDSFLRACLAGCEGSIRLGLDLGRGHYQIGFHQTATAGAFGAALAAGQVLRLSPDQMDHALGLTCTRASGLKSQFGTMGKPYNAGIAASNGVEAALLAARGFISNPEALHGQNGFLPTHHADGPQEQPSGWMMDSISHKFHACCHGLHAALEALESLKPLDPHSVTKIEITTHPRWMTVCNQPAPSTGLGAKFSYTTVAALSLLGYETGALATYADAVMADPQVIALRGKVQVIADASVAETAARVVVQADHRREASYDLTAAMQRSVRAEKIRHKARVLSGSDRAFDAVAQGDLQGIIGLIAAA